MLTQSSVSLVTHTVQTTTHGTRSGIPQLRFHLLLSRISPKSDRHKCDSVWFARELRRTLLDFLPAKECTYIHGKGKPFARFFSTTSLHKNSVPKSELNAAETRSRFRRLAGGVTGSPANKSYSVPINIRLPTRLELTGNLATNWKKPGVTGTMKYLHD